MVLTVINKNFRPVGFFEIFESLRVILKFNSPHEFEMKIPFSNKNLDLLKIGNMFYYDDGYLVNCFAIESRQLKLDNKGESIILKGRSMLSFLDRRIIKGTVRCINKEVVNVLVAIWNTLGDRILENSAINFYWDTRKIDYQNSWGNVLEEFEKICQTAELGLTGKFNRDTEQCLFQTYMGVNRGSNQTENKQIIFSREFGNIQSQTYIENDKDYKNSIFVAGEGEGAARKVVEITDGSISYERKELFIDARDLQKTVDNKTLTDAEYTNMLINRGKDKAKEYQSIKSLEGVIINTKGYEYKKDWNLGDIVTIEDKVWGITMDTRIVQVEEVYANGITEVIPSFGNTVPTLIQKIKRMR
ncbi:MAG: siphovirus ReqiPepy6 Gp37-like family protein [Filifactoraceae bacterium]